MFGIVYLLSNTISVLNLVIILLNIEMLITYKISIYNRPANQ